MNRCQTGFSLIELTIVLAIIGILASIAVPVFSQYSTKAQVLRAHAEISFYMRLVEQQLSTSEINNIDTNPNDIVGLIDSSISTTTFGSFLSEAESTITTVLDGESSSSIHGTTITLSRDSFGIWTCSISNTTTAWKEFFRPKGC